jgi:hypothetical protein
MDGWYFDKSGVEIQDVGTPIGYQVTLSLLHQALDAQKLPFEPGLEEHSGERGINYAISYIAATSRTT